MAMANLSFRGHREKIGEISNGNFLSIIELLAEYDHVLKELLQLPLGTTKYLSPKIQNEVIDILAKQLQDVIVGEIKASQFFSIIMDTTQDISKVDQLSQIFRYVTVCRDESERATAINIQEVFLGYHAVEDPSAAGLENDILKCIESKGLQLSKCRGQGYDGAATMRGVYTGVQARILKREKNALYVHCAAHNLNLVIQDAVSNVPETSRFFEVLQSLYVFFGESITRWSVLQSFTTESSLTLKTLCPTRWSSRYDSLIALRFRFVDVLKALSKLILTSTKAKEREEAMALRTKIESFEFVLLIVVQSKILDKINTISKVLQSDHMDLSNAAHLIQSTIEHLSSYRDQFEDSKKTAITLAEKWGISAVFANKRIAKVKRYSDELSLDERLQDPERRFKTAVFYATLDIIVSQLTSRFSSMSTIVERFKIVQPSVLATESDDDLFQAAVRFQQYYEEDISCDFPGQLLGFRATLQNEIVKSPTVKDLAHLLIIDNAALSSTLPDVCTALLLFLTLPVTVASAERAFSKLALIKNYLRSTMSQQRLSGLALLSIENERARKLDIPAIVDKFADLKARRRKF
ncbi:zinc finger MYM-type protein 1-like [Ranitomeya variabilis]